MEEQKLAKITGEISFCKGFVEQAGFQNIADKLQTCIDDLSTEFDFNKK